MNKIKEFDGIRGVAILFIVTCHICYGMDSMSSLGQYLGGTFNIVFFILSSLLIGLSIDAKRASINGLCKKTFLKKRLLRLVPDLWLFLTLFLLIASLFNISCTFKQIIINYLMLGWFAKLPYCGHLWFVTMILFCYILFAVSLNVKNKVLFLTKLLVICIVGQIIFTMIHFPAYMFLILFLSGISMLYSTDILYMIDRFNIWIIFIVTVLLNACFYYLINRHFFVIGNWDYYYMAGISGLTMIVGLYKLFKKIRVPKFLIYISTLSYQIYLVHHPLCNTNYITNLVGSKFLAIVLIFIVSICCAYILNFLRIFLMSEIYFICSKIKILKKRL